MGTREVNRGALFSLLAANLVVTINQLNIASNYKFIAAEFNQGIYGLGVLTASFFLAYGIFEIPGGVFSASSGPRKILLVGTFISSVGVIGSALSPYFDALVAFRFLAGLGFALCYPSTLVLVVRYYKRGSEGFAVGLMTFATFVGYIIGLSGWSVLGVTFGWRPSILLSGILDLGAFIYLLVALPTDETSKSFRVDFSRLRRIITSRVIVVFAISLFGLGAAFAVSSNFLVFYLEEHFGLDPGYSGVIASMSGVFPLLSGPIAGRLYDRVRNIWLLILGSAGLLSLGVCIAALNTVIGAFVSAVVVGIATGFCFTVAFSAVMETSRGYPEYESFAVGWVDSFSLFGNFAAPIYFSLIVVMHGYQTAWLAGGSVAFLFTLPIVLMRKELNRGRSA